MASSGLDPSFREHGWTLLIHEKKVKHSNRIIGLTISVFCAISKRFFLSARAFFSPNLLFHVWKLCLFFCTLSAWILFPRFLQHQLCHGMLSQSIVYVLIRVSLAHKSKISQMTTSRLIYILLGLFLLSLPRYLICHFRECCGVGMVMMSHVICQLNIFINVLYIFEHISSIFISCSFLIIPVDPSCDFPLSIPNRDITHEPLLIQPQHNVF